MNFSNTELSLSMYAVDRNHDSTCRFYNKDLKQCTIEKEFGYISDNNANCRSDSGEKFCDRYRYFYNLIFSDTYRKMFTDAYADSKRFEEHYEYLYGKKLHEVSGCPYSMLIKRGIFKPYRIGCCATGEIREIDTVRLNLFCRHGVIGLCDLFEYGYKNMIQNKAEAGSHRRCKYYDFLAKECLLLDDTKIERQRISEYCHPKGDTATDCTSCSIYKDSIQKGIQPRDPKLYTNAVSFLEKLNAEIKKYK